MAQRKSRRRLTPLARTGIAQIKKLRKLSLRKASSARSLLKESSRNLREAIGKRQFWRELLEIRELTARQAQKLGLNPAEERKKITKLIEQIRGSEERDRIEAGRKRKASVAAIRRSKSLRHLAGRMRSGVSRRVAEDNPKTEPRGIEGRKKRNPFSGLQ